MPKVTKRQEEDDEVLARPSLMDVSMMSLQPPERVTNKSRLPQQSVTALSKISPGNDAHISRTTRHAPRRSVSELPMSSTINVADKSRMKMVTPEAVDTVAATSNSPPKIGGVSVMSRKQMTSQLEEDDGSQQHTPMPMIPGTSVLNDIPSGNNGSNYSNQAHFSNAQGTFKIPDNTNVLQARGGVEHDFNGSSVAALSLISPGNDDHISSTAKHAPRGGVMAFSMSSSINVADMSRMRMANPAPIQGVAETSKSPPKISSGISRQQRMSQEEADVRSRQHNPMPMVPQESALNDISSGNTESYYSKPSRFSKTKDNLMCPSHTNIFQARDEVGHDLNGGSVFQDSKRTKHKAHPLKSGLSSVNSKVAFDRRHTCESQQVIPTQSKISFEKKHCIENRKASTSTTNPASNLECIVSESPLDHCAPGRSLYARISLIELPNCNDTTALTQGNVESYLKAHPDFLSSYIALNNVSPGALQQLPQPANVESYLKTNPNCLPSYNTNNNVPLAALHQSSQSGNVENYLKANPDFLSSYIVNNNISPGAQQQFLQPGMASGQQQGLSQAGYQFQPKEPSLCPTSVYTGSKGNKKRKTRKCHCSVSTLMKYYHPRTQIIDWSGNCAGGMAAGSVQNTPAQVARPPSSTSSRVSTTRRKR